MTLDHIIPRSALRQANLNDTLLTQYNIIAAGSSCNNYKGKRPLHEVFGELQQLKLCDAADWDDVVDRIVRFHYPKT